MFLAKNIYNWAKHEFATMSLCRKDIPLKKKLRAQHLVNNVTLTVFLDMKGPITIDFLEKGATVNSSSYNQFLRE